MAVAMAWASKKEVIHFFKNHTKRRNSKGCHLRSGDVIRKLAVVVAEVGVSSLGDRNTQDVSPIYRTQCVKLRPVLSCKKAALINVSC